MGLIINLYKKNFLQRFDKDDAIPYYSHADFPGLKFEQNEFQNSENITIRYFTYNYENPIEGKLILFCPGIGPGHTAYLAEIETLCKAGYKVLTLDYTGCGESGGERLPSFNTPTQNAMELLNLLKPQEEIIPIGHSLGGYTTLNLAHLVPEITRAVILAGSVSVVDEMMTFVKLRPLANQVQKYENKINPNFSDLDNLTYLKTTTDKLLWVHSTDDPLVSYKYNAKKVIEADNPNIRVITVENKKHSPHYTTEAQESMNKWIGDYNKNRPATLKERKAYFSDKPIEAMTAQDPAIFTEILNFIKD